MNIIVTGGAGFIGSALIRYLIANTSHTVINIDKLTYAGNLASLSSVSDNERYYFEQLDICDQAAMAGAFEQYQPDYIMHLAAESHVDRSIDGSAEFIQTNIVGTHVLLEVSRGYYNGLDVAKKEHFRFVHISTDEVFGTLGETGMFTEQTAYQPNSPYSASKASSDHLVRAWYETYGLPTVITNCSNNYGPFQFPEKLIPLVILNALEGKDIPVYGKGEQIRDWLFVDDHVKALYQVITTGQPGETYNVGGHNEYKNLDIVMAICDILEELVPEKTFGEGSYHDLIRFVKDRPGHDMRYAIDASKIQRTLGWTPDETFQTGIYQTVQWYLDNQQWCHQVQDGSYQRQRLGSLAQAKVKS